ncbi:hypothetical protein KBZ10_07420 [Streptomyces sp. F63]|uniref:hypothetical protein n=1 Tax=Streptomyces sp. F63 TaxID=2824887 RepID=UPI001B396FBA|nr:hypothetical protein [Streptomyces sp. F63]MBQ0984350.1 hypothetical protein [Streptomyces sp. F63]
MHLRTVLQATAAVLALLTAGCGTESGNDGTADAPPTVAESAGATATPPEKTPGPSTPPQESDPVPSFSQDGTTRILRYGDVEVKATPRENGVFTTVTVHNDTDESVNYDIVVSIGNGVDWVATSTFRLYGVPAHGGKSESESVGGTHLGPIPQRPKIYIDRISTY